MKLAVKFYKISIFFTYVLSFFVFLFFLCLNSSKPRKLDYTNNFGNITSVDTDLVNTDNQTENLGKSFSVANKELNKNNDDLKVKEFVETKSSAESVPESPYKDLYQELYAQRPEKQIVLEKTVYLTFDDGPSERTPEVLDILKKYGVKATFFVVGNTSKLAKECMKRIVSEGHTIAMHTYTHDFKKIYKSVESYLEDIDKVYNLIYETTGVKPSIFRFAGGSKNGFNKSNYKDIINEMYRRGFDYFDWNLSTGDAAKKGLVPTSECVSNVLKYSSKYNSAVVLMHDSKQKTTTVAALPKIIDGLKKQGFSFERLSNKICPVNFSLTKPYV